MAFRKGLLESLKKMDIKLPKIHLPTGEMKKNACFTVPKLELTLVKKNKGNLEKSLDVIEKLSHKSYETYIKYKSDKYGIDCGLQRPIVVINHNLSKDLRKHKELKIYERYYFKLYTHSLKEKHRWNIIMQKENKRLWKNRRTHSYRFETPYDVAISDILKQRWLQQKKLLLASARKLKTKRRLRFMKKTNRKINKADVAELRERSLFLLYENPTMKKETGIHLKFSYPSIEEKNFTCFASDV